MALAGKYVADQLMDSNDVGAEADITSPRERHTQHQGEGSKSKDEDVENGQAGSVRDWRGGSDGVWLLGRIVHFRFGARGVRSSCFAPLRSGFP